MRFKKKWVKSDLWWPRYVEIRWDLGIFIDAPLTPKSPISNIQGPISRPPEVGFSFFFLNHSRILSAIPWCRPFCYKHINFFSHTFTLKMLKTVFFWVSIHIGFQKYTTFLEEISPNYAEHLYDSKCRLADASVTLFYIRMRICNKILATNSLTDVLKSIVSHCRPVYLGL